MIKINGQNIKNILLGSVPIKKVLINETQIWSAEEPEEPYPYQTGLYACYWDPDPETGTLMQSYEIETETEYLYYTINQPNAEFYALFDEDISKYSFTSSDDTKLTWNVETDYAVITGVGTPTLDYDGVEVVMSYTNNDTNQSRSITVTISIDRTQEDPDNPGYDYDGNPIPTEEAPFEWLLTKEIGDNIENININNETITYNTSTQQIEFNGDYYDGLPWIDNSLPNGSGAQLNIQSSDDSIVSISEDVSGDPEFGYSYSYLINFIGNTGTVQITTTFDGDEYYLRTIIRYWIEVI